MTAPAETRVPTGPNNPLGLEPVEGQAVSELGVKLAGTNGAFDQPLAVDAIIRNQLKGLQHGDTVYAVLQLVKGEFGYKPAKSHDGWKRVDTFDVVGVAVLLADSPAADAVDEQQQRVRQELEAKAGTQRMGEPLSDKKYQEATGRKPADGVKKATPAKKAAKRAPAAKKAK